MNNFCFVDTETGGLKKGQPVIQLGWQIVTSTPSVASAISFYEVIKSQDFYFMPDWSKVDDQAIVVNGLSASTLLPILEKQKVKWPEITFDRAVEMLIKDMAEYSAPFVAYNAQFDLEMIHGACSGLTCLDFELATARNFIDVMQPAKEYLCWDKWLKLVMAYEKITGKKPRKDAHSAHADIDMTREIFFKMGLDK